MELSCFFYVPVDVGNVISGSANDTGQLDIYIQNNKFVLLLHCIEKIDSKSIKG